MPKFLTLSEVGVLMNRTPKAMRSLIYRGQFPFSKVGGRVMVDTEELEKYLKLSRQVSAGEAARRVQEAA